MDELIFQYRNSYRITGNVGAYLDEIIDFKAEQIAYFKQKPDNNYDIAGAAETLRLYKILRNDDVPGFVRVNRGMLRSISRQDDEALLIDVYIHSTVDPDMLIGLEKRLSNNSADMVSTGCKTSKYVNFDAPQTITQNYDIELLGKDLWKVWNKGRKVNEDE